MQVSVPPNATLQGTVALTYKYVGAVPLERIMLWLDGTLLYTSGGAANVVVTLPGGLVTTALGDGPHSLTFYGVHQTDLTDVGWAPLDFTATNRGALRCVRPAFQQVFIAPDEISEIPKERLLCDGTRLPYAPSSSNPDAAVAGVDAVIGRRPGESWIDGVRVVVRDDPGTPRLVDDLLLCLFSYTYQEADDATIAAWRTLSPTALQQGAYPNPYQQRKYLQDTGQPPYTLDAFKYNTTNYINTLKIPLVKYAIPYWVMTGDDLCRTKPSLEETLGRPHDGLPANEWANEGVTWFFDHMRGLKDSDNITLVGNEGCDEAPMAMKKPTPDKDITDLYHLYHSTGCMPLAWPVNVNPPNSADPYGLKQEANLRAWQADGVCDYGSAEYTIFNFRGWMPTNRVSVAELRYTMDYAIRLLRADLPRSVLIKFSGWFYKKLVEGDHYQQGDQGIQGADRPEVVLAGPFLAAARECYVQRAYQYDTPYFKDQRTKAPLGTTCCEGTSDTMGPDRWAALGYAWGMLREVQPQLLAAPAPALDMGPEWDCAARPDLFWAVNCVETTLPCPKNLPQNFQKAALLLPTTGRQDATAATLLASKFPPGAVIVLWNEVT
jgi:hypothetical protein